MDEKSVNTFKKTMLRSYSEQQLKWLFWGTTRNYSRLSKDSLKENGIDYSSLIPAGTSQQSEERYKDRLLENTSQDASFTVFLYPDGSASDQYHDTRAKVSLDRTKDKSGFIWNSDFTPNNKVIAEGKVSAFNSSGAWERLNDTSTRFESINSGNITREVMSSEANEIGFLFSYEFNTFILFDICAILKKSEIDEFYSLNGELYGKREVDSARTVQYIRKHLEKNGVNKLTDVIISDLSDSTIDYYKSILG
ncbi:MAG TPA: hypothetical protein PKK43_17140, partial [Spirochaetota bacterium]|nr:hypothetical protein [Spirochaetota bacterium]